MSWHLGSLDGQIVLDLPNVSGDGKIAGKLHVKFAECREFDVSGRLEKGGADKGSIASTFALAGRDHPVAGGAEYVVAAGTMVGPAAWPRIVGIAATIGDGDSGLPATIHHSLLPMMNRDPKVLAAAYAESYMVLLIDVSGEAMQCMGIWQSKVTDGKTSPLGPDFRIHRVNAGPVALGKVCDGTTINIPDFTPIQPGVAPVMVQFLAPADHILDPPLKEAHRQIAKCFDDRTNGPDGMQMLVLQYENDTSAREPTQPINFNDVEHDHKLVRDELIHDNIIIRPQ